ncbi:hypothetical protein [Rheinheimera texasensis]|uniref:hypothetical protein n=1 Tax=Rheinheimera texasensis TaxID=306205 RepID=UPI0004E2227E|nr:hypothetical protein [Rheinheimera texasensis]
MKTTKLIPLFAASIIVAGCSNVYHHKDADFYDVKTTPPLHLMEIIDKDGKDANLEQTLTLNYEISDQHVYKFTYLVEDTMRKRVDHGRVWEEGLSAMQVILAAFASAFSAGTGVHPDVVTTLAGLSALTPDIADIINAGDKAKAYSQGLDLIEKANAAYISARSTVVTDSDKLIPGDKLSPEGAALFVSVMSTLKVMRDALLQTLPSEEDLAKATGKYSLFSLDTTQVNIELAKNGPAGLLTATAGLPTALTDAGQNYYTRVVSVVRGGKLAQCTSDAPSVAVVTACSGSAMTIQPKMFGTAHVTVVAENGSRAVVKVLVKQSM